MLRYRAIGKAFVMYPRDVVELKLTTELETFEKNKKDLIDRKEYLERRINSNKSNMADLMGGGF